MAKKELSIKKGDTFLTVVTYKNDDGESSDLTNVQIHSQVKDAKKRLIANLQVFKEDQAVLPGVFVLRSETDTWPLGEVYWDIQYTIENRFGDYVQSTDTITINVVDEVTIP